MTQKLSRNFNKIDFGKFWFDTNLEGLSKPLEDCENTILEEFLISCNESITCSLDMHAPIKISNRKLRPRISWYNKDLLA